MQAKLRFEQSQKMCVDEVAEYLGVEPRTVRWWAKTGRIRARRIGIKIWQFTLEDVDVFAVTLGFNPPRPPASTEMRP